MSMLGEEEKKHIAIAIACGAAIGAVVGALGYATFKSSTPQNSRRNSCVSSKHEPYTPLERPMEQSIMSYSGEGDSVNPNGSEDMLKAIQELTKRLESLEQAVSKKLVISRSGSSIGGYLTAQDDSLGSNEELFQELERESSDGEDIFFHAKTTQKSRTAAESSTQEVAVEPPKTKIVDYAEIDRFLCSDSSEDNSKAYDDLTNFYKQNKLFEKDPQFLWRFAKSVHQRTLATADVSAKKVFAFRAKELAFEALACYGGEQIADVHKWCAITIGNIGDYVSLQEKISNGSVFKERIDEAIRLNANDEMSHYLLGRWCYSVYMMTWIERKVATSLVSDFPSATIDEALNAFQNAEKIKPCFWIDNQLYLAKCYIEKKDYSSAVHWLDRADQLQVKAEDMASKQEVTSLISKYSSYRVSL